MEAIGEFLAAGNFDVVSLQEVWSESDYQYLKKRTENVLPFAHYFYRYMYKWIFILYSCCKLGQSLIYCLLCSGVVGSGLCILTRYPIITTLFHAWSVNGYVHRIQHGMINFSELVRHSNWLAQFFQATGLAAKALGFANYEFKVTRSMYTLRTWVGIVHKWFIINIVYSILFVCLFVFIIAACWIWSWKWWL